MAIASIFPLGSVNMSKRMRTVVLALMLAIGLGTGRMAVADPLLSVDDAVFGIGSTATSVLLLSGLCPIDISCASSPKVEIGLEI